jgi:hypothetical protein
MAKSGITKDAVSARIRDEMGKLETESRMGGEESIIRSMVESGYAPEINVLGAGISIQYIVDALRGILPFDYRKFSGEITKADNGSIAWDPPLQCPELDSSKIETTSTVRLALRDSRDANPLFEGEGSYDDVVKCAALAALTVVNPYPAAIYLSRYKNLHAAALALIDKTTTSAKKQEETSFVKRYFWPNNDVALGDLAKAYVLMDLGNLEAAKDTFKIADQEFAAHTSSVRKANDETDGTTLSWYAASDGLAILAISEKNYPDAINKTKAALNLKRNYNSALYHFAQAYDEESRLFFNSPSAGGVCNALNYAAQASTAYDKLIAENQDFGVAYSQQAIMLAKEFNYLNDRNSSKCDGKLFGEKAISDLAGKIDSLFDKGLARDPRFFNGWYEWGLFLYEKQWPNKESIILSDIADNSVQMIDQVINRYDRAIKLVEDNVYLSSVNAYFWLRKAEASRKREELLDLTAAKRESKGRKTVGEIYCRYKTLKANVPIGNVPANSEAEKVEAAIREELEKYLGPESSCR